MDTRPLPLLGAFDEAGPHWVEVNVFRFLLIFLNASQSAVEKSRLPEKAPLFSARIDAKRRAHLDRFHYTRDGDRETGEYDRRARRGGPRMKGWLEQTADSCSLRFPGALGHGVAAAPFSNRGPLD